MKAFINIHILTFSNKKVERSKSDRVSAEHVITARSDTPDRHAHSAPDGVGPVDTK